ncbi:plasmid recombination protein [Rhizobiaceae bacterium BDR2-2]|uniref:Plasmid recombination protein n=1 Tax=Ectorhizobium quercum TaxID=2965071 RepID=A0AAE3SXA5_9HYPH|nr:plasmid recombination protein [Ectorhizobium quercum]
MPSQFVHVESWSRKGNASGRSTGFIFAEARRDPDASVHVANPALPVVVYGVDVDEVERRHNVAADLARTTPKGGKPKRIRQDQHTLITVVASHHFTVEEVRDDPLRRRDLARWESLTVRWLKAQYGDQLVSVLRHEDESHWHLHAYVLPSSPDMRASALHPGQWAKAEIMQAGAAGGEDSKAVNRRGDRAYKAAMRLWQDSYYETVAAPCGLTRLGPQRRRLTRAEWKAEQLQARALRETLDRAQAVKQTGESWIATTKEKADRIAREATAATAAAERQMEAAKAATAAALTAQDKAVAEQRKAQGMMARVRAEAVRVRKASARIQSLPGILRNIWDGFCRSTVQDRIHAAVETEMNDLRGAGSGCGRTRQNGQ